jgi:hypothetical protein
MRYKGKMHFGQVDSANESNPYDEWGMPYCMNEGDVDMTRIKSEVTCKNCLRAIEKEKSRPISSSYYF